MGNNGIQISESETARARRTPEWTYAAPAPDADLRHDAGILHHRDHQLYNNRVDPDQPVNMAGRLDARWPTRRLLHYSGERPVKEITEHLRPRVIERMVEAGEERPQIDYWPCHPWARGSVEAGRSVAAIAYQSGLLGRPRQRESARLLVQKHRD